MKFKIPFWNIITKYKFNSIFFKYFKFIVLTTIVPFIILNTFIYINNYQNEKKAITNELNYSINSCISSINTTFEEINRMSAQISNNAYCKSLLYADLEKEDAYIITRNASEFHKIANNFITGNSLIAKIYLYCPNSNYVHSTANSNYLHNFPDLDWYEKYSRLKGKNENFVFETQYKNEKYITICHNISTNTKYPGVIVIQLYKDKLENIFSNYRIKNATTAFYFINAETNDIITRFNGKNLNEKNVISVRKSTDKQSVDFKIATDLDIFSHSLGIVVKNTIPYIIFTLLFTVIVAYMVSVKFYKSLAEIMATLENSSTVTPKIQKDELSYINTNILNTIVYTKKLEQEFALNLSALERSQTAALQSQINPHFLFNTLNLVNTLIYEETGKVTGSMKIVNLLSELYGELIDNRSYLTNVQKELGYAEKYLEIELIKNEYMFDVEWDIEYNAKKFYTLKMILQPIIENAIAHGIKELPDEKRGKIKIKAYIKNDNLYFKISDNGPGITEEKLKILNENLSKKKETQGRHIGLININSRIKLIYGVDYGVSINSNNSGTEITVKLPIINEKL